MNIFKRIPIRVKLILIAVIASVLSLLVAFGGFIFYDLTTFRSKMSADLRTEAEVIGANCSAAMAFKDKGAVEEVLRSLKSRTQLEVAAVYAPDGRVFATYRRPQGFAEVPHRPLADGARFTDHGLAVYRTIRSDKDAVGVLFMQSSMADWYDRRNSFMGVMGWLILLCIAIALVVAWRLQRLISGPILELASTMRAVATEERYDQRVARRTEDEVGELVDGFNSMLAEIEERDRALHLANDELEDRVRHRTAELEREVADRKAAQDLLTKSQQSLADFFENATVGLHWLAPDGVILRANRAELEMLGYESDEYVGRNIAAFHEDEGVIRDILSRLARGETITSYEARMRCKDGRVKDVSIESNVLWESGTFIHTRCFTRDISAQKEAERARLEREKAEQANYAKNEFLSRMSHELRTPMNAIMGFGQILAMDELSEDQRDSVDRLMAAGKHLLKLINEVLDISRIETGNLTISNEPVRVADVIREVMSLVHPLAEQRRVALVSHVPEADEVHAYADHQRLNQVLLNLVSNAIKYNVEFGEVHVELQSSDYGLRCLIWDTGPGIPPDKAAKIFTPFERLGAEQTGVEGTGLGLALSKHLCEAMGCQIGLLPAAKGACFFVDLPLADSPLRALEVREPESDSASPQGEHQPRTVLVVEDNLSNVRLMERIFKPHMDTQLIVSPNGEAAISMARQHSPDVILLDLNLPDISGEEVLRRIKSEPRTQSIPIIIVSADATPSQVGRLKKAGAVEYLTKPVDIAMLMSLVDSLVREVRRSA